MREQKNATTLRSTGDGHDSESYNPPMSFLRYLMLLSLIVWLGGLIFFAFVLAPTAFSVLPTRHLAGTVVGRSLGALHWMGIVSGIIFLASSIVYSQLTKGSPHVFAARHVLICLMLALTLISQFAIIPRMDTLRASIGEIDSVPPDNPARMQFDGLHVWSTRVESGVFLLGLVVVYLTAALLATSS
ncbi:MAG TPA: DUF4149 domain-containing protein [Terriglobales bacterium]|nr:DUF4149 domain-containing protein [Terriglobales bacterium]